MSRSHSWLRLATAALVAGGALAGCSVAADEVGSSPAAPAEAKRGGLLKVGITAPGGIDPINAYEPSGKLVASTLCDTLVVIDPETGQLREALATGWVLADDGLITVKTRHDLRFSNGQPVTSKDVNYSLQQLLSPANGSYARGLAEPFNLNGLGVAKTEDVLVDPDSRAADVVLPLNTHDFQLGSLGGGGSLRAFAEPALAPFSRSAYQKDPVGFAANPVCAGPYRLARPYTAGATSIELVRAEHYYGHNVGFTSGGVGYPDRITFRLYTSSAAALAGYRRGEVDVVPLPARAAAPDTGSLVLGPATAVEYLGLPTTGEGPLSDRDVRIALSQALDREALVRKVFGPTSLPADGFLPPALDIRAGRSAKNKATKAAPLRSCGDLAPPRPDVAAAREHLATAAARPGAKPLTGFTLQVNSDAPYPALAAELARQWRAALGLKVTVTTTPWDDYVAKASQGTGMTDAFRIRWASSSISPVVTYNDQQSFLQPLLAGTATGQGNWAHFSERDFEYGLEQDASKVTDVQQRGIAFGKLAGIACEHMPLVPLAYERPAYLIRSTAVGSAREVPVGRDGLVLLRELYLK